MAIPYPSNPSVGDTFTYGGIIYTWSGTAWISVTTNTTGQVGSVFVTAPITNTGTPTAPVIGINQSALSITNAQVSDFSNGSVSAAFQSTYAGTASYATAAGSASTSGTASYAVLSGTAVYGTTSGTAVYATNAGTAVNISGTITAAQVTGTAVTVSSGRAIPAGGTAGQVLSKVDATDYNTTWSTPSAGGSFTGGTLTSNLTLASGASIQPITFGSTSPTGTAAGSLEFNGTVFYGTTNGTPGKALDVMSYYYASSSDYFPDFTLSGAVRSLLGGNTTGITVPAGTTYEYEFYTTIQHQFITNTGVTGTYAITSSTVSGSPTVAVTHQLDYGSNTTNFTTATTLSTIRNTSSVVFSAAISSGSRYNFLRARGLIRVTGTGTAKIYPGLSTSQVGASDNVWTVQAGTVFKLKPIGNGTVTTVGAFA